MSSIGENLLLAPLWGVVAELPPADVRITVLRPPYSCIGCGTLRLLRAHVDGQTICLVAGYDDYQKLASQP